VTRDGRAVRHTVLGVIAILFALGVAAPRAGADTRGPVGAGAFKGSRITTPERVAVPNQALVALIKDNNPLAYPTVTVTFSRAPGIPSGCTVSSGQPQRGADSSEGTTYSASTSVNCNGAYPYKFEATVVTGLGREAMDPPLTATLNVEVPPSAVNGVSATVVEGTRNVSVKWTTSSSTAPDFLGYLVQRRLGSGSWSTVNEVDEGTSSLVDSAVPADPGTYSYRVLARRAGIDGEVLSAQGNTDSVTLTAGDPTTTTIPDDGSGTTIPGGAGTGGDGTGGTDGTGATGGDGTTPTTTGKPTIIKGAPRARGTTLAPNLGKPAQSTLGILIAKPAGGDSLAGEDGDGGYDESLPFGDPNIDGSLADDEEGGSSIFYPGEHRGLAIPVATGFVLFAWAIHLRFLARASRPEAAPQGGHYADPFDPFYDPML
jgi:hypothetical protein